MSRCYLIFVFIFLAQLTMIGQDSDSIRIREIRTGVYSRLETISEKPFSQNLGYGVEVGAFQERKLLGQVFLSYGAGIQYRNYNDTGITIDTTPNTDTSIIVQFYDSMHDEVKFTSNLNVRFVYISNPKIYMTIGVAPEITLQQSLENIYSKTRYVDDDFNTIIENSDVPVPVSDDEFKINTVNIKFEIGLGIELNKFNLEIVNRTNNVQGLGLRIKYRFNTLSY